MSHDGSGNVFLRMSLVLIASDSTQKAHARFLREVGQADSELLLRLRRISARLSDREPATIGRLSLPGAGVRSVVKNR